MNTARLSTWTVCLIMIIALSSSACRPRKESQLQTTKIEAIQDVGRFVSTYNKQRKITKLTQNGQTFDLETSTHPIRIEFLSDDVVKVRVAKKSQHGPEYTWSIAENFKVKSTSVSLAESAQSITLKTPKVTLVIDRDTAAMKLFTSSGNEVLEFQRNFADPFDDSVNQAPGRGPQKRLILGAQFKMYSDDHFYGLGEKLRGPYDQSLDWRGRKRDLIPSGATMGNQFDGADGGANGNIMIPFLMSTRGAGVFLDTAYRTYWEFDDPLQKSWYAKVDCDQDWEASLPRCERAEIRFYFFVGSSKEILGRYTDVTGKPIMPPRWMLGYLQSNYGYRNWNELHGVVSSLRKNGFPLDGIFLDLQWFGGVPGVFGNNGQVLPEYSGCEHRRIGSFEWSKGGAFDFSKPKENLSKLRASGVNVLPIEEGYFDTCLGPPNSNQNFAEAQSKGFLARKEFDSNDAAVFANGDDSTDSNFGAVGYFGQVGMIDTSNPEARKWFWSKHLPILKDGAALFWTDLGEPERYRWWWKYSEGLWHQDIHNVWDLNRARSFYEGYQRDLPKERPFVLSRSGYAGSQRYGVGVWSADTPSHLSWAAGQMSAHMNLAISGLPYTTSDIGGFGGFPYSNGKQFTRWIQMESFSSLMRAHGNTTTGSNAGRIVHPDGFGEPYTSINRLYIAWRQALIPYIYTYAREAFDTGFPIVRALPLIWPKDSNTWDIGSQFLLGDSILVAPVILGPDSNPDERRDIYLPEGKWIDMHDGTPYSGKQWLRKVSVPLAKLPLFAKAGSIIPKAPDLPSTSHAGWSDLRIFEIYPPDNGSASFDLYDDDGSTNGYRAEGAFAKTPVTVTTKNGTVDITIGEAKGTYPGIPNERTYVIELYCEGLPIGFKRGLDDVSISRSDANLLTAKSAENRGHWNGKTRKLYAQFPKSSLSTTHNFIVNGCMK